jgi:hypothetical protein
VIPGKVKEIESEAFYDCYNLKEVCCKAKIPPISNLFMFCYGNECKLCVPSESLEAYKSADDWNKYFDCIVSYNLNG